MIEKTVKVGDREVKFKSSAAVPRMYRVRFGRDIFKDFQKLRESFADNGNEDASNIPIEDLELFENVAYIMALHADPSIPDSIDAWLEGFEMFSIYDILPQILDLWGSNLISQSEAKKNTKPLNAK